MTPRRHYPEITVARGLIALLVILGHAFPDGDRAMADPLARGIHDFIYSFHMGAFIFIAGFVAAPKLLEGCDLRGELRRRFRRLLVPYVCWTAVLLALKQVFGALARQRFSLGEAWKLFVGAEHLGWLWYLWTLFVISALFLLLFRWHRDARWALAVGLILYLLHPLIPDSPLARVAKYAVFYALGVWARAHEGAWARRIDHAAVLAVGLLLPVAGALAPVPYLLTGCAGTALVLWASRRVVKWPGRANDFWRELGERSYDVYLLGYYVQTPVRVVLDRMLHVAYWPQVAVCAALGLIVPLLLSRHLVPRLGWFRRAFLGYLQ